jgi:hypothetical protein
MKQLSKLGASAFCSLRAQVGVLTLTARSWLRPTVGCTTLHANPLLE